MGCKNMSESQGYNLGKALDFVLENHFTSAKSILFSFASSRQQASNAKEGE